MSKITDTIRPFVTRLNNPTVIRPGSSLSISMKTGEAKIYDDGTNTITVPIWGYKGQYPGPVIEVERDQTLKVKWKNKIERGDTQPCKADSVEFPTSDGITPQNVLDSGQASCATMGANGEAFLSVHLHGGKTIPASDGWPESMLLPQDPMTSKFQLSLNRYENPQRAMMLWYHDHAMHTTRLNNYAGLAGVWMIRDDEEKSLNLPKKKFEVPLVIQDRNLTDFNWFADQSDEHARFLHRVEHGEGPLEFFGPLTLVNGAIWPRKKVEPAAYRLRVLNGSNSRFYRLRFAERLDDESYQWVDIPVKQIGTDCGLMNAPVDLPATGLTLAPAERADLIVDFASCIGKNIVLLNTAEAPFSNSDPLPLEEMFPADPETHTIGAGNDAEAWRTPYPEVMMFAVKTEEKCDVVSDYYDFSALEALMQANVYSYIDEDPIPRLSDTAEVRTVVLIEKTEVHNGVPNVVLVEWELEKRANLPFSDSVPTILQGKREIIIDGESFVVTAERFQDPVNWHIRLNDTERWRFINLTADTHPMHVHLVQFKAISRKAVSVDNPACTFPDTPPFNDPLVRDSLDADTGNVVDVVDCKSVNGDPIEIRIDAEKGLDANELGFKDTIRVNPDEIVEIVATFEGYCGRYVYHCHLLEHEDHDMMRQFIVTRDDMMVMEEDVAPECKDITSMHGLPISVGK